jgi:hypothetical protein
LRCSGYRRISAGEYALLAEDHVVFACSVISVDDAHRCRHSVRMNRKNDILPSSDNAKTADLRNHFPDQFQLLV